MLAKAASIKPSSRRVTTSSMLAARSCLPRTWLSVAARRHRRRLPIHTRRAGKRSITSCRSRRRPLSNANTREPIATSSSSTASPMAGPMPPSNASPPWRRKTPAERVSGALTRAQQQALNLADDPKRVAEIVAKKYAYEAYPQWVAANPANACPASIAELREYTSDDATDPWGHPYKMMCGSSLPMGANGVAIQSAGSDGQFDTCRRRAVLGVDRAIHIHRASASAFAICASDL